MSAQDARDASELLRKLGVASPSAADVASVLALASRGCCSGASRDTVGLVCRECGTDYSDVGQERETRLAAIRERADEAKRGYAYVNHHYYGRDVSELLAEIDRVSAERDALYVERDTALAQAWKEGADFSTTSTIWDSADIASPTYTTYKQYKYNEADNPYLRGAAVDGQSVGDLRCPRP